MTVAVDFRKPATAFTAREIAANLEALGYPEGWSAADDLLLVAALFRFGNMLSVSIACRKTYAEAQERWNQLRLATVGHGEWSLTAQLALLDAVKARVEVAA